MKNRFFTAICDFWLERNVEHDMRLEVLQDKPPCAIAAPLCMKVEEAHSGYLNLSFPGCAGKRYFHSKPPCAIAAPPRRKAKEAHSGYLNSVFPALPGKGYFHCKINKTKKQSTFPKAAAPVVFRSDIPKRKSAKYFVLFLLFMLVCTLVSRGIYAWQMPQVALGSPEGRTLLHKISAAGTVEAAGEQPVTVRQGLLIADICVSEGQKVEAGDTLIQLDLADLEALLEENQAALAVAEAKLEDLQSSEAAASEQQNTDIARAKEDLANAAEDADAAVSQADSEYQEALDAQNSLPSEKEYREQAAEQDAQYQSLSKAAGSKKATKEDKEAFQAYKSSFEAGIRQEYAEKKEALQAAVAEKAQAAAAAESAKKSSLSEAGRALEDAQKPQAAEQGGKIEQQNAIDTLKETEQAYRQLLDAQGRIASSQEGFVRRILAGSGERTGESAVLVLSDASAGCLFTAEIPAEDRPYINLGDKMTVTLDSGKKVVDDVPVEAITQTEGGTWQITGRLAEAGAAADAGGSTDLSSAIGTGGTMDLNAVIGKYACCVPLSALYADNGAVYVLLAEEQETILGTEWIARRRNVKILAKDGEYAALEGEFSDEEKLITASDREIADGDRIRLAEE